MGCPQEHSPQVEVQINRTHNHEKKKKDCGRETDLHFYSITESEDDGLKLS